MADDTIANLAVEVEIDTSGTKGQGAVVSSEVNGMKTSISGLGTTATVAGAKASAGIKGVGTASATANTKMKMFNLTGRLMGPMLKGIGVPAGAVSPAFRAIGTSASGAVPGVASLGATLAVALAPIMAITLGIMALTKAFDWFKKKAEERKAYEASSKYFTSVFGDLEGAKKDVEEFSKVVGKSSTEVMGAVTNLGMTFRTMGLDAQDALTMSKGLVQLADSMATIRPDMEFADAMDLLKGSIRGTSQDLLQFGIVMTEADRKQFAITNGLWEQGEAWDALTNQIVNYNILLQQFGSWANKQAKNEGGDFSMLTKVAKKTKEDAEKIDETIKGMGLASFDKLNNMKEQSTKFDLGPAEEMEDIFAGMGDVLFFTNDALEEIKDGLDEVNKRTWEWNILTGYLGPAWDLVKEYGGKAWGWISEKAGNAWNTIKEKGAEYLGPAWEKIKEVGGQAWDTVKNVAGNAWDAITTGASKVWDAITNVGQTIANTVKGIIDGLASALRGIFDTIGGWINGLKDKVSDAVQGIKDIGGGIWEGAKSVGGKIGSFFGLADGGVALPRKPGLVQVGDNLTQPEIVAPMSYIRDAVAQALTMASGTAGGPSAGGGNITIDAPIQLDGVTVGRLMWRYVEQEGQRANAGSVR